MEDKEIFLLAIEEAPIHIVITDVDGKIIYANKAAEKITGFSNKEMMGKRSNLWGRQMSKEYYEKMWNTIKMKRETFKSELFNKRKSGKKYRAKIIIKPVVDKDTSLVGFVGIEQDISKSKKTEERLLVYTKKLKEIYNAIKGKDSKLSKIKKDIDILENELIDGLELG